CTDGTFALSPGDFLPILPYSGMFFFAAAISPYLYCDKKTLLPEFDGKWNKPVCFIGRHTLIVYVAHLVFIVAVLELASYFGFHEWLFLDMF
ncbi:MAG: heparan-alpha-glucosaminide N-acetyltransferase domain-containing protein, partial [Eubacteriales bacterium]|nr:heparan-alpha-glucosaminide N-acetyltransferase domain-containing protein [Eubacteriales bacterium]